ncbi:LysM peptidoglycan-binding domain-containing protein [Paenibacillus aurantius]|uniref:LysM peptidoglycan-binding domain-containing protein n=1 Tax=Paenibacillus aurantius TaxID=2918900 RepID=A0AA96LJ05_9BACL|nr:LysM peptidoglycan-binding domain-containing protein [Paenibacillus aurantius]WNQ13878.1 LysM peptidoglycan-binding domain-containing protein [Paenibacillus aurantius]
MKSFIRQSFLGLTLTAGLVMTAAPAMAASYQLKEDDTFWKLAQARQIPLEAVLKANPGVNPANLQAGQSVQLPDTYRIKEGDTFWNLSKKLGVPLDALVKANAHLDPLNLYEGLVLTLPAKGSAPVTSKVKAAAASSGSQVVTASGQALSYKKAIPVTATAYSASAEENGKWGPVDYNGNPLKLGTIAVDPSVIPMGSKVYITGYTSNGLPAGGMIAYANDQGSAIKGSRIDIFMPGSREKVSEFGLQNVTVYVLD